MHFVIRPALDADAERLELIEKAADELLIHLFQDDRWPPPDSAAARLASPGIVLVGGTDSGEVVGFAHLLEAEGHAHLEQVSVLPRFGRLGLGACSWRPCSPQPRNADTEPSPSGRMPACRGMGPSI